MDKIAIGLGAIAALLIIRNRKRQQSIPTGSEEWPTMTVAPPETWASAPRSASSGSEQRFTGAPLAGPPETIPRAELIRELQTAIANYDQQMGSQGWAGYGIVPNRLFYGISRTRFIDGLWGPKTSQALQQIARDYRFADSSLVMPHMPPPQQPTNTQLNAYISAVKSNTGRHFVREYDDAIEAVVRRDRAGLAPTTPIRGGQQGPWEDARVSGGDFWDQWRPV
jgi:hypothetical protein